MAIERTFSIIKPDATERNLTGAVNAVIEKAGLRIVATTLDGDTSLDNADMLAAPTAWVFGPESQGLPEAVTALADHRVLIPMSAGAESLNVAAAAAICLYQSARAQRQSIG